MRHQVLPLRGKALCWSLSPGYSTPREDIPCPHQLPSRAVRPSSDATSVVKPPSPSHRPAERTLQRWFHHAGLRPVQFLDTPPRERLLIDPERYAGFFVEQREHVFQGHRADGLGDADLLQQAG